MATYGTMIYSFLTISLAEEDFEREKQYIMNTARKNGYNTTLIETLSQEHA